MKRIRLALATLAVAAVATPAGGQAAPAATFQAFEGRTDSYAVGLATKQLSALPLPVEAFLTRTRTEVNSQPRAQAYAGIVDVPLGELLGMYGFPAKLPTYCYADYPGETDSTCGLAGPPGGGDAQTPAPRTGQGRSHVEGDGFNLDATAAESSVGVGSYSSDQLTVGASNSHSVSRIVDGALENTTEVVLQQVDIKGVVTFEQLRATARAVTNGRPGGAKSEASLTVSGVSIAGQRVSIPGELDLATLHKQVFEPLSSQLEAQGVTLTVLSPPTTEASPSGDTAVASVAGLRVESSEPATGNRVGVTLGVARASAVALPASDPLAEAPVVPEPLLPEPTAGTPAPADAPGEPATAAVAGGTATAPSDGADSYAGAAATTSTGGSGFATGTGHAAAPSLSTPGATAVRQPARLPAQLATEVIGRRVAERLPVFYAVAALAVVGLGLLGFRLAHRARR
jgi:hypothetical protein